MVAPHIKKMNMNNWKKCPSKAELVLSWWWWLFHKPGLICLPHHPISEMSLVTSNHGNKSANIHLYSILHRIDRRVPVQIGSLDLFVVRMFSAKKWRCVCMKNAYMQRSLTLRIHNDSCPLGGLLLGIICRALFLAIMVGMQAHDGVELNAVHKHH